MTNCEDMENALLDESKRRFTQASSTPFMTEPLFSKIGKLGVNDAAQAILDGTFQCPPGVEPVTQRYIQQLIQDRSLHVPTFWELRSEILREGWKKSRENTASGPSGLTFAHFIANANWTLTQMMATRDQCLA